MSKCQPERTQALQAPTWMTTSDESTTLYSSPQMRLDWPLSKPFSRVPFFSPSKASSTSSLCFLTYLWTRITHHFMIFNNFMTHLTSGSKQAA